jgi:anti-sigma B factor antagonist
MARRDDALGEPFQAHTEQRGRLALISLVGVLGSECRDELRHVVDAVDESHSDRVVVDLRGLTFIDSIGLRTLIESEASCRERGLDFALIPGKGPVKRTFEMTGLAHELTFIDEQESRLSGL